MTHAGKPTSRPGLGLLVVGFCAIVLCSCAHPSGGTAGLSSGASPVDGWEPIGLSGGGGMFAPAISPLDPDLMMLSCDMSGAYITTDAGRHWQMIPQLQLQGNTRCRPGFHPKNADIIYAADGGSGRLKVSQDRGAHWTEMGDLRASLCGEIAFDRDDPSLVLAGAMDGAWVSRDSGDHWEKCAGPAGEALGFAVDRTSPTSARALLAATREGIWRSDDSGRTWEKKTEGLPSTEIRSFAGGSDPKSGLTMLYCAIPSQVVQPGDRAGDGQFGGGVYRSRDAGEHWESAMGNGINKDTQSFDEWADGSVAQYQHVLTTNAKPLVAYAFNTSTGFWPPHFATVYRTDDGGDNWRPVFFLDPRGKDCNVAPNWFTTSTGRSEPSAPFGAAVCASDPDRVLHVGGFVYATDNGGRSWYSANTLLAPGQKPEPGSRWLCSGLVVTTTWHYYVDPFQPNRHYIAYTDIGLARSLDAGKTWIWWPQAKWPPWVNTCYELAFDPQVPGKVWAAFSNVHDIPNANIIYEHHQSRGPGGLCLSTDFADTWQTITRGLPVAPATSIVLDPKSRKESRTLYASFFDQGVYKSTDDGKTWVKKSRGLGAPDNLRVYRLILHQDGTLFALVTAKRQGGKFLQGGAGLYRSRDGGETWKCITTSLGLTWPKDFAVSPRSSKVIFVGAANGGQEQSGLYRTTDGGATWKRVAREGSEHFGAYFDPKRLSRVYMTLTEGPPGPSLWVSDDNGETWRPIRSFPFANAQRVEFDRDHPEVIYVTTFGGSVFRGRTSLP